MATKKNIAERAAKKGGTAAKSAQLSPDTQAQVEAFVESIKEETEQMATTTETPAGSGFAADRFQTAFGDVNERAKAALEKSSKVLEELTELTKGNVEAVVASSRVAAKGVETLTQEAAEFGRRSFENASEAIKSLAQVKSPADFFRLQNDYAKSAFDNWVAESSKTSETVVKLAGEITQPIASRYSVAAERVKSVVAF